MNDLHFINYCYELLSSSTLYQEDYFKLEEQQMYTKDVTEFCEKRSGPLGRPDVD